MKGRSYSLLHLEPLQIGRGGDSACLFSTPVLSQRGYQKKKIYINIKNKYAVAMRMVKMLQKISGAEGTWGGGVGFPLA